MLVKTCSSCDGSGAFFEEKEWVPCQDCEGTGFVDDDPQKTVYVNVYAITREVGGSEEGGWYYNHHESLKSVPVLNEESDAKKEELEKEFAHISHGNLYSVLGGTALGVYIESTPNASETVEPPRYE